MDAVVRHFEHFVGRVRPIPSAGWDTISAGTMRSGGYRRLKRKGKKERDCAVLSARRCSMLKLPLSCRVSMSNCDGRCNCVAIGDGKRPSRFLEVLARGSSSAFVDAFPLALRRHLEPAAR